MCMRDPPAPLSVTSVNILTARAQLSARKHLALAATAAAPPQGNVYSALSGIGNTRCRRVKHGFLPGPQRRPLMSSVKLLSPHKTKHTVL